MWGGSGKKNHVTLYVGAIHFEETGRSCKCVHLRDSQNPDENTQELSGVLLQAWGLCAPEFVLVPHTGTVSKDLAESSLKDWIENSGEPTDTADLRERWDP